MYSECVFLYIYVYACDVPLNLTVRSLHDFGDHSFYFLFFASGRLLEALPIILFRPKTSSFFLSAVGPRWSSGVSPAERSAEGAGVPGGCRNKDTLCLLVSPMWVKVR